MFITAAPEAAFSFPERRWMTLPTGSPTSSDTLLGVQGGAAKQFPADALPFVQSGTGAVPRTVQDKAREIVSVFDFMSAAQIADAQAGTAMVDVTAAVRAAFAALLDNAVASGFGVWKRSVATLLFPAGRYKIDATAADVLTASGGSVVAGLCLRGEGYFSSQIEMTGANYFLNNNNKLGFLAFENLLFVGTTGAEKLLYTTSTGAAQNINRHKCSVYNFARLYVIKGTGNNDYFAHFDCDDWQSVGAGSSFYEIDNPQSVCHYFYATHWSIQDKGLEVKAGGEVRWWGGGLLINSANGCFFYGNDPTGTGVGYQNSVFSFNGLKVELRDGKVLWLTGSHNADFRVSFSDCSFATRLVDPADAFRIDHAGHLRIIGGVLDYKIQISTDDNDIDTSWTPYVEVNGTQLTRRPDELVTISHTGTNYCAKGRVSFENTIYRQAFANYPAPSGQPTDQHINYDLGYKSGAMTERAVTYMAVGDTRGLPANTQPVTFTLPKNCFVTRICIYNTDGVADQFTAVGPSGATWITSAAGQKSTFANVGEKIGATNTFVVNNITSANLRNGFITVWYL